MGKYIIGRLMQWIGKNFGSDIGFEDKHMIYFYMGSTAILLWKAGWIVLYKYNTYLKINFII